MYVISGAAFSKVVPSLTFRVSNTHLCNRESKVGFWFLMCGDDDNLHNLLEYLPSCRVLTVTKIKSRHDSWVLAENQRQSKLETQETQEPSNTVGIRRRRQLWSDTLNGLLKDVLDVRGMFIALCNCHDQKRLTMHSRLKLLRIAESRPGAQHDISPTEVLIRSSND